MTTIHNQNTDALHAAAARPEFYCFDLPHGTTIFTGEDDYHNARGFGARAMFTLGYVKDERFNVAGILNFSEFNGDLDQCENALDSIATFLQNIFDEQIFIVMREDAERALGFGEHIDAVTLEAFARWSQDSKTDDRCADARRECFDE